jgi:peptidoglycan/LPS O-acetylase OafA/YrhL
MWIGLTLYTFILFLNHTHYNKVLDVTFRDTAKGLIFIWLIHWTAKGLKSKVGNLLEHPLMTYLGKISYSIYVIRFFVYYVVLAAFTKLFGDQVWNASGTWLIVALLSTTGTLILAIAS